MVKFEELSKEVQEEIKGVLGVYDKCNVIYMNGKYHVMTASFLLNNYPSDFKYIGDYKKEDILTETEIIEEYANNFHSFHENYNGVKNYKMFNNCSYSDKFKLINGELKRA